MTEFKANEYDVGVRPYSLETRKATVTAVTLSTVTSDILRLLSFKSSERLIELYLEVSATAGTGIVTAGLRHKDPDHVSPVVDANLFGTFILSAGVSVSDYFTNGDLGFGDRGKTLWELAAVGAATYVENPYEDFDLYLVATETFAASVNITVEAIVVTGAGRVTAV